MMSNLKVTHSKDEREIEKFKAIGLEKGFKLMKKKKRRKNAQP